MSSNFEYRYVSLNPEQTASTEYTYGTAGLTEKIGEVDDESFQHMFDLLTRSDMSRYGAAKSINGKEYSEGGLNMVAQPDDFLGLLLYGLYGTDSALSSAGGYGFSANVHTFSEHRANILPSFTIKVNREDNLHIYTGMTLSRFSLSAAVGEYVTLSADFTGQAEDSAGGLDSLGTPTFTGAAVDGFHFAEGEVKFSSDNNANTASALIKSISMEFNTNLNTDDTYSLGSRTCVRKPEPQMREITGTVEFSRPVMTLNATYDDPDYTNLIAEGGLLYDGGTTAPAISLKFTNAGSQSLEVKIRKCRWEAPSLNVSGRDSSTMSVNFVALVDSDYIMSTTVLTLASSADYQTL